MGGWFVAWWMRYEQRLAAWASFVGLIGLPVTSLLPTVATTARETAYAASWALLCGGGFFGAIICTYRLGRRAKYAEVLPHLRNSLRLIVEETSQAKSRRVGDRKATLSRAMDEVSAAFSILSGSSCRCCIKVVRKPKPKTANMEVVTFCRNTADTEAGSNHPIDHNTDFSTLYLNPSKEWFFGVDLPAMAGRGEYTNTSADWMKKYRSTAVWPIRAIDPNPQSEAALVGFLCLDSKRP